MARSGMSRAVMDRPKTESDMLSGAARGIAAHGTVETDVPSRLDSLPFGRFHLLVIVALGITWIFDGLEVTLAGALVGRAQEQLGARA